MTPWPPHEIAEHRGGVIAELERELTSRRRTYPDRVAKGRMGQDEADYQLALWREILDNVAECLGTPSWHTSDNRFAWRAKVGGLERELNYRRRLYPEWISKGRLDQSTADSRIAIVAAVHDLYWRQMFAWFPPEGLAADYLAALYAIPRGSEGCAERHALDDHPGRPVLHALLMDHINLVDGDGGQQQELLI